MDLDKIIANNFRGCCLINRNNEVETKFATASAGKVFVAVGRWCVHNSRRYIKILDESLIIQSFIT